MEELPQDWLALAAVVLLLGLKHGFDADHLAAIDGMTRFNAAQRPRLARLCGVLFSLGHGAVVVAVALGVSFAASQWQTPEWLEATGSWISIAFLLALGLLNLDAVLRTAPGEVVRPAGLRGRWIGRLAQAPHPALVALVGALFALSFDTISQAALFSLTATRFGGWEHALALGLLFTLGMLVMDGVNGWWISRLLARADRRAVLGSRIMGLTVAAVSLLVAGLGIAKQLSPAIDTWSDGKELLFGCAVIALVLASYALVFPRRPKGLALPAGEG